MSQRSEEYELLTRTSSNSSRIFPYSDHGNYQAHSFSRYIRLPVWLCLQLTLRPTRISYIKTSSSRKPRRLLTCATFWVLVTTMCIIISSIAFTASSRPSYTHSPVHFKVLQQRCEGSNQLGRGNVNNEKVFIAATLYDPEGVLIGGDWGSAVSELVNLLAPDNVVLSVYENDLDVRAKVSLERFVESLSCDSFYRIPKGLLS